MPNIFICGYEKKKAEDLKRFIDDIMQKLGLQDDAITSILETRPQSCDGRKKPMPYLWVRSTEKDEIFRIIDAFKKKGLRQDLEWDVIGDFISADEMLEKTTNQTGRLTCCKEGPDSKCEPNERPPGYCMGCGG